MLWRKLLRDIRQNFGAYLAVISVLVIGLMLYVSLSVIFYNLTKSQEKYYGDYRFADGFTSVVSGPQDLPRAVGHLDGIDQVAGRIIKDVLLYHPEGEETTTVRLVSFSPNQPVNKFRVQTGRLPREDKNEILVSPAFLKGNDYVLGDKIPLIILGKEIDFIICGTASSPEYIYEIPNGQTITPNAKSFGVGYVSYSTLAYLFNMEGQINNVVFTLDRGSNFDAVKGEVARVLKPYGLTQIYPRKQQLSHSILNQELVGVKASATATPVIFLIVAAGTLYIMLRRMVEHQRGQIGLLKAFGFSDWQIITHYLSYATIIGLLGGLLGGLSGSALSFSLATLYQQYFDLPDLRGSFSPAHIFYGTVASLIFSIFAGFQGTKQVLRMAPVEAMRPPAPAMGKKIIIEKIAFLWNILSTQGKMASRNIIRNKERSLFALIGTASAFSMMVSSGASYDATDFMVSFQYNQVEKYDLKIGLAQNKEPQTAIEASKSVSGVKKAEALLEVPATISNKWLEKDIAITGLAKKTSLYQLLTSSGEKFTLPENGLVISSQLAKVLHVTTGDIVTLKPYAGERKEHFVRVQAVIPQYIGLGAYMNMASLSKIIDEQMVASSVLLTADKESVPEIKKILQSGKNVISIDDKTKAKEQFSELMASSQSTQYILLFFAFLTGFAIIYNISLISVAERERELATLLVLGMTEGEVARILIFEQSFLGLLGAAIGVPLSYAMLYAITSGTSSDMYNLPLIISSKSFAMGLAGTILFFIAAQWKIQDKINKLPMLDVLKQQE